MDINDESVAVQALREISGYAKDAGLRVALYPHTGFFVQSVEDAVLLAEKVNCKNLGVTFNTPPLADGGWQRSRRESERRVAIFVLRHHQRRGTLAVRTGKS